MAFRLFGLGSKASRPSNEIAEHGNVQMLSVPGDLVLGVQKTGVGETIPYLFAFSLTDPDTFRHAFHSSSIISSGAPAKYTSE